MISTRLGAIGLLVANAIGAGIFALPYAAQMSGWAVYLFYLIGLGALLALVHHYYGHALDRVPGHHRLVGLVHLYLPRRVFPWAVVSVSGGLLVTLVAYLILGGIFFRALLPGLPDQLGIALMWAFGSYPLFVGLRRMVLLEFGGAFAMAGIIVWILTRADNVLSVVSSPAVVSGNLLFPFAPVLFALAAWTAIGPMREHEKKVGVATRVGSGAIWWGSAIIVALYAAFAFGIIASAFEVTPDTLSGLLTWPSWSVQLLALLGLIAIWTSYVPIAREARDSLQHDFEWPKSSASIFIALVPLALIGLGLTNFMSAIELAGGVFLSAQYIFVVLVSQHAVRMKLASHQLLNLVALFFFCAALYELVRFVVR